MGGASSVGAVVDAYTEVDGLQGGACDIVDLTLEEGTEGTVHGESARVAVGDVHTCGEHCDCDLATLFGRHRSEVGIEGIILRGLDDELQTHIVERLCNDDTTVEYYASACADIVSDGGFGTLGGGDVQPRVHRVARELHIAAVLDGEGLQRDDGQRVFHLTAGEGIAACEVETLIVVFHAQVASAGQVGIVSLLGVEVADKMGTLRHGDGEVDIHTCGLGTSDDGLDGVGEVGELHQFVETVVG